MEYNYNFRRYFFLGCLVAFLWVLSAAPDIWETYLGNRLTNDVSFTPAWLKAIRDISTFFIFIWLARSCSINAWPFRVFYLIVTLFYVIYGIRNNAPFAVSVRGVLWIPILVWIASTDASGVVKIINAVKGVLLITIPASILTSVFLGIFGPDVYYETLYFYKRNPGIFLAPSATAFMSCLAYIFMGKENIPYKRWALISGFFTLSGVFYANALMGFGRFSKWFYRGIASIIIIFFLFFNLENLIFLITYFFDGIRSGDAISLTLGTRFLIFQDAIHNLSFWGNFPVGLNVAANQELDLFFPDNAILAAVFAFGTLGFISTIFIFLMSYKSGSTGTFVLLLSTSFFYVWFENILFSAISALLINKLYWNNTGNIESKI